MDSAVVKHYNELRHVDQRLPSLHRRVMQAKVDRPILQQLPVRWAQELLPCGAIWWSRAASATALIRSSYVHDSKPISLPKHGVPLEPVQSACAPSTATRQCHWARSVGLLSMSLNRSLRRYYLVTRENGKA